MLRMKLFATLIVAGLAVPMAALATDPQTSATTCTDPTLAGDPNSDWKTAPPNKTRSLVVTFNRTSQVDPNNIVYLWSGFNYDVSTTKTGDYYQPSGTPTFKTPQSTPSGSPKPVSWAHFYVESNGKPGFQYDATRCTTDGVTYVIRSADAVWTKEPLP